MGKTGSKTSPKSYRKLAKIGLFYRVTKTSCWGKNPGQMTYRSTDRSIGQRSFFRLLGLPVDRPINYTQVLTCRSTTRSIEARARELCSLGRSTGARSREQALWISRPPGRPALKPGLCACSMHIGRPLGRPSSGSVSVDRSVGRQKPRSGFLGFENLDI